MKDVVIVSACRTAIGGFGGTLKDLNTPVLGSIVMKEAVKRAGIDPAMIDDVRFGCCMEPVDGLNSTRVAALMAGIPDTVTAVTVNRVCISGMEAVLSGMALIRGEMADIILAGGMEHMSGAPYSVPTARWGCRFQDQVFVDNLVHGLHAGSHMLPGLEQGPIKDGPVVDSFRGKPYIMGITAELVAYKHNLSREEIDEVALRSHNNVERATKEGDFKEEIVPIELPQKKGKPPLIFDKDEQGHGGHRLGHQRRRQRHGAHVGREGQRAGSETPGPHQGFWARRLPSVGHGAEPRSGGQGSADQIRDEAPGF
jgi:acetyl-CoA C-acetyltransferase